MNPSLPDANGLHAVISQLFVYPIKSCGPLALSQSVLTDQGLEYDRAWMVVDEHGEFLSQRELPRMALVQPQMRATDLVLRAPGMLPLHLSLQGVEGPAKVRVWDDELDAWDMGALAAQWFSDFLGRSARLVRFDPEVERPSDRRWTGGHTVLQQFTDGFPLMVIGQPSLDDLNRRLQARGQPAAAMLRFRPNIVLAAGPTGQWQAHDEDRVDLLQIETAQGQVQLRSLKPCARCSMVDVDQQTGQSGAGVLQELQAYRKDPRLDGALTFGMNLMTVSGFEQTLAVGQTVRANLRF